MKITNKRRLGFNICLLGQIASGKDTQAKLLLKKYQLKTIETGKFSRLLVKEKSKQGDLFRKTSGKGTAAPTADIQKFLSQEIKKIPKTKDILFLGGPRLKPEAQLLKKIMLQKNQDLLIFYISLPDKEIYRRSFGRKAGTGNALYKMFDTDHIIAKRIKWHKNQVSKTVDYWEKLGKVRKINGIGSVKQIEDRIQKEISKYENSRDRN